MAFSQRESGNPTTVVFWFIVTSQASNRNKLLALHGGFWRTILLSFLQINNLGGIAFLYSFVPEAHVSEN